MAKYIQIQLKTPCHEKWEQMQAAAAGSFCNSCQKTVIDFTNMTDNQLMEYFKKPSTSVCGRFYADQLEKKFEVPVKKIPWLKYFFQVSIPALLFNYKATAQYLQKKNIAATVLLEKKFPATSLAAINFTGTIRGFNGTPLPGATVMVHGTGKGTAADSNGVFSIKLTENERLLEVTMVGYEKKSLAITDMLTNIQLNILTNENIVLPAVTVSGNIRRVSLGGAISGMTITSIWHKKDSVRKTIYAADLFPNPVKRNGGLTIRWKNPVTNDQQITVYNSSGIRLL